ncbi:MAG TPA: DUF2993 domain-containing protein [Mycobacteriales bacterium]|nr:DUF2993 domain-containing protein [Mycobacteriales bacterium]
MRKLIIGIFVVLVLLVAADRVGVLVADVALEGVLKDRLALQDKPKVRVHGIPFLTQVIGGKYDNIEVHGKNLDAGKLTKLDAQVHLRGAHIGLKKLFTWNIDSVPVDQVTATVTMPYSEVASLSGVQGLKVRPDGKKLAISGPVPISGRTVPMSGTAHAEVQNSDLIVIPDSAKANGADIPPALLQGLRFTIRVRDLPFDLRLTDVTVTPDGLAGSATAKDIVIRADDVGAVR